MTRNKWRRIRCPLTEKLSGRAQAPDWSRGRILSSHARGDTTELHGPLQRLLEVTLPGGTVRVRHRRFKSGNIVQKLSAPLRPQPKRVRALRAADKARLRETKLLGRAPRPRSQPRPAARARRLPRAKTPAREPVSHRASQGEYPTPPIPKVFAAFQFPEVTSNVEIERPPRRAAGAWIARRSSDVSSALLDHGSRTAPMIVRGHPTGWHCARAAPPLQARRHSSPVKRAP
jgi:hypothetical protein